MFRNLDPLSEGAQMVAPKSAVRFTHPPARDGDELRQLRRREALVCGLDGSFRTCGVYPRLIARRLQFLNPLFRRRIFEVRDTPFDRVIETLQVLFFFHCPFGEFIRLCSAASAPVFTAVEMRGKHVLHLVRVEQPVLQI